MQQSATGMVKEKIHRKPKLLIASRIFVASGQPWLWRQTLGLYGFDMELLCWERHNSETYPTVNGAVHLMQGDPAPYDGAGRWWYRLRNVRKRNFYAAVGQERQEIAKLLDVVRPDVILCHFGDIGMRLLLEARRCKVPLVAYFHGDFQFCDNRWYRWSLRRCASHFSAIIVVTDAERRWMLEHGVEEERLHWVPCGAPTDLFRPRNRADTGPIRFVMVSRLSVEKGCDLSIRAFALVSKERPNSELHLYGDGPKRERLHELVADLGLKDRVIFHGYVDERLLAERLPGYDVFIQHTVGREGSPVSVVEAMACGLPVVATPAGDIMRQVVSGETGLLVEKGDVSAMAAAMLELVRSPDLRWRLGKAGRERAVALYDSSLQTRRLEQVLLNVAGSPVHPGLD